MKADPALPQFIAQTLLIGRLKQAWSELAVYFYGEANNPFGERIIFPRREHLLDLSLPHCLTGEL
jgi:hypothetical protein